MEPDTIVSVLNEILQTQADISASNEKEAEAREQVFLKMEAFDKKLETLKATVNNEIAALSSSFKQYADEIKETIAAQPKTIVHEKSFQLFPNRPEEYYKIIFGNLFKGLVIFIVFIYALVIINRYIREQEYLQYKKAWQYLYSQGKEDYKMFLDSVWKHSGK